MPGVPPLGLTLIGALVLVHLYLKRLCLLLKMYATVLRKNLTGLEKKYFSPKNVMPDRLCSAYFRAIEDLRFQDILSAVTNSGVPSEEVRFIQCKKVSQFAKEVHVTFSTSTFCTHFVNSKSLAIN